MQIRELMERLGHNTLEVMQQAARCETADELLRLAEKHSISLSAQEAEELVSLLRRRNEELSAAELDAVTGGSDSKPKPKCECGAEITYTSAGMVTTWKCDNCGRTGWF